LPPSPGTLDYRDRQNSATARGDYHKGLDEFDMGDWLGEGAYATVRECTEKATGARWACKTVNKLRLEDDDTAMLERERDILMGLDHPNIVRLHRVFDTPYKRYMILELVTGGTLFEQLQRMHADKQMYNESKACEMFRPLVSAIAYMHEAGIAHRDLKPENILLTERDSVASIKIADFGLARDMRDQDDSPGGSGRTQFLSQKRLGSGSEKALKLTACGTLHYVAPEVLQSNTAERGYTVSCDVWSAGVILHIMLSGDPPFHHDDPSIVREQILGAREVG
jgi:serine/threonine protein kinase